MSIDKFLIFCVLLSCLFCLNINSLSRDSVECLMHRLCKFCKNDRDLLDQYMSMARDTLIDFHQGMRATPLHFWALSRNPSFSVNTNPLPAEHLFEFLVWLYNNKNNLLKVEVELQTDASLSRSYRVPRIIHQIWLHGSMPKQYSEWKDSWINHHTEWEYKLWTEDNIKDIDQHDYNLYSKLLDESSRIAFLTCEILYRYGGVFVDNGFECLYPFGLFNHCYGFYIAVQPFDTLALGLGGIIGAAPNHPIISKAIELIGDEVRKGSIFTLTQIFTKSFWLVAPFLEGYYSNNENGVNIAPQFIPIVAFPSVFFYPVGLTQQYCNDKVIKKLTQGSFACYHWSIINESV